MKFHNIIVTCKEIIYHLQENIIKPIASELNAVAGCLSTMWP